jgi:hypothetical protein
MKHDDVYGGVIRFLALCLLLGVLLASVPLWAQECRGNSCNGSSPGDVTVDTVINSQLSGGDSMASSSLSVGGSRAYAFGGPSFDVDIAQCLASKSDHVLFGLYAKQRVSQNLHCMGLAYMAAGMPEAAKYLLCDLKESPLAGMPGCPGPVVAAEQPVDPHANDIEAQADRIDAQMAMISSLSAELEDLKARPSPPATTVIRKESALTPEQKAGLEAIIRDN